MTATELPVARRAPGTRRPLRMSKREFREALQGYAFATPWILGLIFFTVGPILASMYLSFTQYNVLKPPQWVGLDNYVYAFTKDQQFWPSLGRTFRYAVMVVPLSIVGSFFLAMLLNQDLKGTAIYRTLFFLPHLTPVAAMAILWKWLLQAEIGPVNYLLGLIGIQGPAWLSSQQWALPSLAMISVWAAVGGNEMLIFLAGLQGVPKELYEAAELDGAGRLARVRHVTLPMVSPSIFFNLVLALIGALKVFSLAFVGTAGGPGYATWFYALHIYRSAFENFEMGYASALAWVLAVILFGFTYIQVSGSSRWVYYEGEAA